MTQRLTGSRFESQSDTNETMKGDTLQLNETGRKLLFRDKRYRLTLYNIENEQKTTLLSYASYVQWVPGSDVVVAQSRDNLCVWYNIDSPDRVTMFPIKGDIQAVVREEGLTEVIVLEGTMQAAYQLDEGLIEFATAMDDNDFGRAITFLEQLDQGGDAEAMWRQLAAVALEQRRLHVAQRCYAALGDISRARYLEQTLRVAQQAAKQIGGDGTQFYQVRARLAIMNKEFKDAERIYLEQVSRISHSSFFGITTFSCRIVWMKRSTCIKVCTNGMKLWNWQKQGYNLYIYTSYVMAVVDR